MVQDDHYFMRIALEEAGRGGAEGNSAVGSIIVRGGEVIARGRNLEAATRDPTAHAEMVAIRDASTRIDPSELPGCALYTTFEPCPMCCGAIIVNGISKIVMGARHTHPHRKWGDYSVEKLVELAKRDSEIQVVTGVLPEECMQMRQKWEAKNA